MQRDIDLIREILLAVEKKESPKGWMDLQIEGYSKEQISYHVKLLKEAGYLEAKDLGTRDRDGYDWRPINLTWQGHDFLDAARDNRLWNKAKKHFGNKIASISFELLKAFLVSLGKQELGL